MQDKLFQIYVLSELAYKEKNQNLNFEEIFPYDWYRFNNYKLKIEIISEALKNNILIKDTKLYNSVNYDRSSLKM